METKRRTRRIEVNCVSINQEGLRALLETTNADLLDKPFIETCAGGTTACETLVMDAGFTQTGVVADCLRRWMECKPERQNTDPYWTEYYCLTVIALPDESRTAANACLSQNCVDVVNCLIAEGAYSY